MVVDAPPLPPVRTGVGTLVSGPPADGRSTNVFPLVGADGEGGLGTLWLEADTPGADILAKALGLALDAAWSRASARQTIAGMASLDEATRGIAGVLSVDEVLQVIVDASAILSGHATQPSGSSPRAAGSSASSRAGSHPRSERGSVHCRSAVDCSVSSSGRTGRTGSKRSPITPTGPGSRPTIHRCTRSSASRWPSKGIRSATST